MLTKRPLKKQWNVVIEGETFTHVSVMKEAQARYPNLSSNEQILKAVKIILTKESKNRFDWANAISDTLKLELDESICEADQGKTLTHEEAMKQIKNRYNL